MKKLIEISKLVKGILEENPETRDDDNLLWMKAMRETAYEKDCTYALDWDVSILMGNIRNLGLPSYETVSRARRKLQAQYPDLRGTSRVRKAREERERVFEDFARNEISL